MNPKTEIILDMLTSDSVSVLRKQYFEFGGQKYYCGNVRNAYMNSVSGREQLKTVLSDEYYNAVMAVWGDTPTVEEPTESESENNAD